MQDPQDRPDPQPAADLKDLLTGRRRLLKGGAAALAGAAALRAGQTADGEPKPIVAQPTDNPGRVKGGWIGMNRPKA